MVKVVINMCYGGFGLSEKAMLKLYELGSPSIKAFEPKEYYGGKEGWEEDFENAKKRSPAFKPIIAPDGKILSCDYDDEHRSCPHLIEVVKEMGADANGHCAKLETIEIPDDVEWQIEEYDGTEWVAEKHRIWPNDDDE